jgi:hypothetical protein
MAIALLILGGCGVTKPQQLSSVTPTRIATAVTALKSEPTPTGGSLSPEEVAADIIPKEGDPTSYGLSIALNNTQRFMDYYNTISLTPEQESVRRDALLPLKAPCCDDNSMYNC